MILDYYEEEEEEPTYASIGTQTDFRESSVQCGKGDFAPLPRRPLTVRPSDVMTARCSSGHTGMTLFTSCKAGHLVLRLHNCGNRLSARW